MSVIEVWTAADLDNVRNNMSGEYIQKANIDYGGNTFTPIGTPDVGVGVAFTGKYNGAGYTISNINPYSNTSGAAIFGLTDGATLENIRVANAGTQAANISGTGYVAILVGWARSTTISNCFMSGTITMVEPEYRSGFAMGGVVGYNEGGSISRSYAKVQFSAPDITAPPGAYGGFNSVGGLVGINSGDITNCFAVGGFSISDRHVHYDDGGLIGENDAGIITNCYAAMTWEGFTAPLYGGDNGGLIGRHNGGSIVNSYYDSNKAIYGGIGTPKTTIEMQTQSIYVDWDFVTIWGINPSINDGYPYFQSMIVEEYPSWFIGDLDDVTWEWEPWMWHWEEWPYDWDDWDWEWEDWDWSTELFDITFIVTDKDDIPLPGSVIFLGHLGIQTTDVNGIAVFENVPIQYWLTYTIFTSNYQFYNDILTFQYFQTHTNYALTIEVTMEDKWINIYTPIELYNIRYNLSGRYRLMDNISLSRYANWLPIGNEITPFTGQIDGNGYEVRQMTIISGVNDYQALFGAISGAEIKKMGIKLSVVNGDNCALLVGYCNDSLIEECYAAGEVSGTGICGGLVSNIIDSSLLNCYSRTEVTGDIAGGLAGQATTSTVLTSYSSKLVDGESSSGGLIGEATGCTIINCYYDTEISTQIDTGKGIPISTDNMKKEITYSGWDFNSVWDIDELIFGS